MATRAELSAMVGDRYRGGNREERGRILDEFAALTGYHRKHAIRLLAREPVPKAPRTCCRATYGAEVQTALRALELVRSGLFETAPGDDPAAVAPRDPARRRRGH